MQDIEKLDVIAMELACWVFELNQVSRRLPVAVMTAALGVTACGGSNDATSGDFSASTTPGCKRGVAWPGRRLVDADAARGLSFWYNWSNSADGSVEGVTFEPMVRAATDIDPAKVHAAKQAGAQNVLGFNEPNFFEQANLSAADAASRWPELEAIADAEQLGLVGPAVNFCGDDENQTGPCHDTNPVHYLQSFFSACAGCRVDFVAVHWYNCDVDSLTWYLDQFKQFGRPIWLTEFACAYGGDRSPAGQEHYMRAAIPVLEAEPSIFRYAWFSASPIPEAQLFDEQGTLTPLGRVYVELPHAAACAE
jgi:hypothetical protein